MVISSVHYIIKKPELNWFIANYLCDGCLGFWVKKSYNVDKENHQNLGQIQRVATYVFFKKKISNTFLRVLCPFPPASIYWLLGPLHSCFLETLIYWSWELFFSSQFNTKLILLPTPHPPPPSLTPWTCFFFLVCSLDLVTIFPLFTFLFYLFLRYLYILPVSSNPSMD